MQRLTQYQKEITDYITKGRLDQAIKRLSEIVKEGDLKDEIVLHHSNLSDLEQEQRQNLLKKDDYRIAKSKVKTAILSIKSQLTENDLKTELELQELRLERLCVVTAKKSENKSTFKKLLNANYFKNVAYCSYEEALAKDQKEIDFYIYDYAKDHDDVLKAIICEREKPVLIFVRGYIEWIKNGKYNPDRYTMANTTFTIHSRLNEMIETQKWLDRYKDEEE